MSARVVQVILSAIDDTKAAFGSFSTSVASAKQSLSGLASSLSGADVTAAAAVLTLEAARDAIIDFTSKAAEVTTMISGPVMAAGASMVAFGLYANSGFGMSMTAAANLESELVKLKRQAGETKESLMQFALQAHDMAGKYGSTATNVVAATRTLLKSGFKPSDVDALLGVLGKVSVAAELSLDGTSAVAASLSKIFKVSAIDMEAAFGHIAAAAEKSSASFAELLTAVKDAGPAGAAAGMSFQQVSAVMAALSDAGMKGAAGVSSFKAILNALTKNTADGQAAMRALGVEIIKTSDGSIDLGATLKQISTLNLSRPDYFKVFGEEAATAMISIDALVDRIRGAGDARPVNEAAAGALDATYERIKNTYNFAERRFSSVMQSIGQNLSLPILDASTKWMNLLSDLLSRVNAFIAENPRLVQAFQVIGQAVAIVALPIGGLVFVLGLLLAIVPKVVIGWYHLKNVKEIYIPLLRVLLPLLGTVRDIIASYMPHILKAVALFKNYAEALSQVAAKQAQTNIQMEMTRKGLQSQIIEWMKMVHMQKQANDAMNQTAAAAGRFNLVTSARIGAVAGAGTLATLFLSSDGIGESITNFVMMATTAFMALEMVGLGTLTSLKVAVVAAFGPMGPLILAAVAAASALVYLVAKLLGPMDMLAEKARQNQKAIDEAKRKYGYDPSEPAKVFTEADYRGKSRQELMAMADASAGRAKGAAHQADLLQEAIEVDKRKAEASARVIGGLNTAYEYLFGETIMGYKEQAAAQEKSLALAKEQYDQERKNADHQRSRAQEERTRAETVSEKMKTTQTPKQLADTWREEIENSDKIEERMKMLEDSAARSSEKVRGYFANLTSVTDVEFKQKINQIKSGLTGLATESETISGMTLVHSRKKIDAAREEANTLTSIRNKQYWEQIAALKDALDAGSISSDAAKQRYVELARGLHRDLTEIDRSYTSVVVGELQRQTDEIQGHLEKRRALHEKAGNAQIEGVRALREIGEKSMTEAGRIAEVQKRITDLMVRAREALAASPDKAVELAAQARQAAVQAVQDIDALRKSIQAMNTDYTEMLRTSQKKGMSPYEAWKSDLQEVQRLQAEARQAAATGDARRAEELARRSAQMAAGLESEASGMGAQATGAFVRDLIGKSWDIERAAREADLAKQEALAEKARKQVEQANQLQQDAIKQQIAAANRQINALERNTKALEERAAELLKPTQVGAKEVGIDTGKFGELDFYKGEHAEKKRPPSTTPGQAPPSGPGIEQFPVPGSSPASGGLVGRMEGAFSLFAASVGSMIGASEKVASSGAAQVLAARQTLTAEKELQLRIRFLTDRMQQMEAAYRRGDMTDRAWASYQADYERRIQAAQEQLSAATAPSRIETGLLDGIQSLGDRLRELASVRPLIESPAQRADDLDAGAAQAGWEALGDRIANSMQDRTLFDSAKTILDDMLQKNEMIRNEIRTALEQKGDQQKTAEFNESVGAFGDTTREFIAAVTQAATAFASGITVNVTVNNDDYGKVDVYG